MTVSELKKYIYKNEKIPFILEQIGCGHIKYHQTKDYFSCSNYNGDNKNAIIIKNNEYLNCINYTRNLGDNSDLLTLIGYNKNFKKEDEFKESVKYLHKILGLKLTFNTLNKKEKEEVIDPLYIFKKVKKHKKKTNVADLEILDESILNDFTPYIHMDWYKEGIMPWTVSKFGLGYSYKHKRIIIPHRYWLTGSLVGIMGRTTIDNYEMFDIKKYIPIWYDGEAKSYDKGYNLYGLWENYSDIQKAGYVVIYESEKSTLKRHSLGDSTGTSLMCHSMTDEQIKILIGLNVEIIIALDKDVSIDEVRSMCEKFYGIRNISYIYDKWDLIGLKDCPADASNKIFNFMYKYRIKYDLKEHNEYLKSIKRDR